MVNQEQITTDKEKASHAAEKGFAVYFLVVAGFVIATGVAIMANWQ